MKAKNLVSNWKNVQADDNVEDQNDGDKESIDVGGPAHDLEPSLFTDFILEAKLLKLFPTTDKVNETMRSDLNKHQGVSSKGPKTLE